MIDDPNASLHICGGGELKPYVEEMCKKDSRIHYYGVVPAEKANEILQNADVLVNPRQNDDEYTKYSFPSKNIEYLMTGNSVVAYMLDGMPSIYQKFLYTPKENSIRALSGSIESALKAGKGRSEGQEYISKELNCRMVAKKILQLIG